MTYHSHWLPLEYKSVGISDSFHGLSFSAQGDERLSFHSTFFHQSDVKTVSKIHNSSIFVTTEVQFVWNKLETSRKQTNNKNFQGLKKYQSLCMLFIQIKLNSVQIFSENTFHKWQRERQLCKFLQENEKYAPTSLRGLVNFTKILWECEDKDKSVPPQHGKRQADLSIPTRATTGCVSQANYPVPVTGTCTVLWPVVWTSQSDFWSCKTQ